MNRTNGNSLTQYNRLKTREVKIGNLLVGNDHPIRIQTMTTTDTMNTLATVEQAIRCIEAGAELVRITAPSKREAENFLLKHPQRITRTPGTIHRWWPIFILHPMQPRSPPGSWRKCA